MTGLVWDTSFAALAKPLPADTPRERLWADLAKPEWELAGPALSALASRPDDFVSLVHDRLPAAAGPDFDPDALKKLVGQLGDATFAARERASAGLARHGREVLPLLQEELGRTTSAEQRRRLQAAIDAVARSPVPSEHLRQVRLLSLLEQQKTDAARAQLKRLAAGHAAAALTGDAKAALARSRTANTGSSSSPTRFFNSPTSISGFSLALRFWRTTANKSSGRVTSADSAGPANSHSGLARSAQRRSRGVSAGSGFASAANDVSHTRPVMS